jgi:hypothetical protein
MPATASKMAGKIEHPVRDTHVADHLAGLEYVFDVTHRFSAFRIRCASLRVTGWRDQQFGD